jgi:hypothetical protein
MRRRALGLAVLWVGIQAEAGVITQGGSFSIGAPGSGSPVFYNQLDPASAPLNDVTTLVTLSAGMGSPYLVTNLTGSTISFNVRLFGQLNTDAGSLVTTPESIVPVTLGPLQTTSFTPAFVPPSGASFFSIQTTDLGAYIGTGTLFAGQLGGIPPFYGHSSPNATMMSRDHRYEPEAQARDLTRNLTGAEDPSLALRVRIDDRIGNVGTIVVGQ